LLEKTKFVEKLPTSGEARAARSLVNDFGELVAARQTALKARVRTAEWRGFADFEQPFKVADTALAVADASMVEANFKEAATGFEEAQKGFQMIFTKASTNTELLFRDAESFVNRHMIGQGIEKLDRVLSIDPAHVRADQLKARLSLLFKLAADAEPAVSRVADPVAQADMLARLAILESRLGHSKQALDLANRASQMAAVLPEKDDVRYRSELQPWLAMAEVSGQPPVAGRAQMLLRDIPKDTDSFRRESRLFAIHQALLQADLVQQSMLVTGGMAKQQRLRPMLGAILVKPPQVQ
jgi:tetratricopeptide (TPR) repeat protein